MCINAAQPEFVGRGVSILITLLPIGTIGEGRPF